MGQGIDLTDALLACLGSFVIKQLNANPSEKIGTALDIEENSRARA